MKPLFAGLLLLAAFAAAGCAPMGTTATLQIGSAPPPPSMAFGSEPQFNYLSNHRVGAISDEGFGYDMFSSGGNYYLFSGGYWYRSPSPRGPFVAVDARRVPRSIFDVNDREYRWRAHPDGWRSGQQQGANDSGDNRRGDSNGGPGH